MKRFIYSITPVFIRRYNDHLLKNNPLGWQLQIPTISWISLLVLLITIPLPFLYQLDNKGSDYMVGIIAVSILISVLEVFLFVYLLIQFNNTKSFGKRLWLNGFKEQLGYLYVFMLCTIQIVFYPLIIEYRKGNLMTEQEIIHEAKTFNKARYYFMDDNDDYRYFPTDSLFKKYMEYTSSEGQTREIFYAEKIKPLIDSYFINDSVFDSRYKRDMQCPKLYYLSTNGYLEEDYIDDDGYYYSSPRQKYSFYQLGRKTDADRLKEIEAFIQVYKKYSTPEYSEVVFESPQEILMKYKDNQFAPTMIYESNYSPAPVNTDYVVAAYDENAGVSLDGYRIQRVHSTIIRAQRSKWNEMGNRLMTMFIIALVFSTLLFLFKNIRLREFILMFVYSGLLALAVSIITIIIHNNNGDLPIHVPIIIFVAGLYFSFISKPAYYSSIKTIFVMLSNLVFAFAPIYFFFYFHEYHDIGKLDYTKGGYCDIHPDICMEKEQFLDTLQSICLWGGIAFYLFVGSTLYKKVYERIGALPLHK